MTSAIKVIATINSLIQINNKRFERYSRAADMMKDINGKLVCMKFAVQAKTFNNKLNRWLLAYGSAMPVHRKSNTVIRGLNSIKDVLSLSGKKYIWNDCAFLERESIKTYNIALGESLLPYAAILDIQKQRVELEEAYQTIKSYQDNKVFELQVA